MQHKPLPDALVALMLCAMPALAQSPDWQPRRGAPLTTGLGPSTLSITDLNGDDHPDLLTGHLKMQKIAAWLGDGRAGFTAAPGGGIAPGYETGAFASTDLNGDARADIVIASRNDSGEYVQVFLNDGHGGFSSGGGPKIKISDRDEFYKPLLQFADFNEDGSLDVLAGNGRREHVRILLGDGRGGFTTGSAPAVHKMPARYFVAVGDVDGDSHADMVSAVAFADGRPSRVAVHLGDGAARFRIGPTFELNAATEGLRLELADLDADKRTDLVLSHGRRVDVFRNVGAGRFVPATSPGLVATEVFAPQIADLNSDGRLDIAVASEESVMVFLNGPEGFRPATGSPFAAGPGSYHLGLADINHDGRIDLLTSSLEGNAVGLLLGK